jgi:hypothetical protein
MRIRHLIAAAILGAAFVFPVSAATERYEASLDRYVDLLYTHHLGPQQVDALVEQFRNSMLEKEDAKSCPALREVMNEFVDTDFRKTINDYMRSPEVRGDIEKAFSTHLTQEDLDAYLAFVESPAGKRYAEHEAAASGEMERLLALRVESIAESPAFKEMMGGMITKLMPVMMKCSK